MSRKTYTLAVQFTCLYGDGSTKQESVVTKVRARSLDEAIERAELKVMQDQDADETVAYSQWNGKKWQTIQFV